MKPQAVDLVLLVDASKSMHPCFARLRDHLQDLLLPLQQANFRVRFGLVAYASAPGADGPSYDHTFVGGSGVGPLKNLYSATPDERLFFTGDPAVVGDVLSGLKAQGNENTLLALDIAADFPFGPSDRTKRVVAVFTDEPLEHGVSKREPLVHLPALIQKLYARRIQLFVAAPSSDALDELGTLDGAQISAVNGGDGLASLDFSVLLGQMGKSLSLSTLQMGHEPHWHRALFGQDQWGDNRVITARNRERILAVGESAEIPAATQLRNVAVQLNWTAAVDLDLHAFVRTRDALDAHVFWAHKVDQGVKLDRDAGIRDTGGQNSERITIASLEPLSLVLFATKIYSKGGCYADYDGQVSIETDQGDRVVVPLTSRDRADWCVIARLKVELDTATITNINRVENGTGPAIDSYIR